MSTEWTKGPVSAWVDGREVFYTVKGISLGRGKVWELSPERRKELDLELPLARRRKGYTTLEKWDLLNTPEILGRLTELARRHVEAALPVDYVVAMCSLTPPYSEPFVGRPHPEDKKHLSVIILSNTFPEIGQRVRHPLLEKSK